MILIVTFVNCLHHWEMKGCPHHTLHWPDSRDYSKSKVIDDFATLHPRQQQGLSNWSPGPAGVDYAKWQIRGRRIYFWPAAEKSIQLAPSSYTCTAGVTSRVSIFMSSHCHTATYIVIISNSFGRVLPLPSWKSPPGAVQPRVTFKDEEEKTSQECETALTSQY